jgi:hypothetical protein
MNDVILGKALMSVFNDKLEKMTKAELTQEYAKHTSFLMATLMFMRSCDPKDKNAYLSVMTAIEQFYGKETIDKVLSKISPHN